MKTKEIIQTIIDKDFNASPMHSARIRWSDRTLFALDHSGKLWNPVVSFGELGTLEFPTYWTVNLASLSINLVNDAVNKLSDAFNKDRPVAMTLRGGPLETDEVKFRGFSSAQKGTGFMLRRGLIPADHFIRKDNSVSIDGDVSMVDFSLKGNKPFAPENLRAGMEAMVEELAYQTISRENLLRDEVRRVIQCLDRMASSKNSLMRVAEPLIEQNFAPPCPENWKDRSRFVPTWDVLNQILTEVESVGAEVKKFNERSSGHFDVAFSSSYTPVHQPGIGISRRDRIGIEGPEEMVRYSIESPRISAWGIPKESEEKLTVLNDRFMFNRDTGLQLIFPETTQGNRFCPSIKLKGPDVLSFYGFQFHFPKIKEALASDFGVAVPNLWGQTPEEWDILEIAAPRFLKERSK